MSNPRFTFADTVLFLRHVAVALRSEQGVTCGLAFEIANASMTKKRGVFVGRESGTYIDALGSVHPIVAPRPEAAVPTRRIHPVSIDSLVETDGDATHTEVHEDDPIELNLRPHVPVAGEDNEEPIDDEQARMLEVVEAAAIEDEVSDEGDDAD
jgi:hypothetical protein